MKKNEMAAAWVAERAQRQERELAAGKRAEPWLRLSLDSLEALINRIADAMVVKDDRHRFVLVNDAECALAGQSRAMLLGKTDGDFFPKEQVDVFWKTDDRVLETGEASLNEETVKHGLTGELLTVMTHKTRYVDQRGNRFVVALIRDISERKRAEENLGRLHQHMELILRSAAEGILGLDLEGNQTFVNPAAARMLGYAAEELLGRPSHSTWHHTKPDGSPYPKEESVIYATIRDGAERRVSTEVLWRKDGTSFPVEYASKPLYEQGRLAGAVVTFTDITLRQQAQAQLEAASRQAGMAEVATNVLHNVGNVLNSVNTSMTVIEGQARVSQAPDLLKVAELLEQHRGDLAEFLTRDHRGDKIVTYLRTLAQHLASRQAALLAEVVDLTKNVDHIKDIVAMQQGYARTVGLTERVVVADLVNDALAMHTRALLQHGVQVVRDYDPRVPGITVEKHTLLQILVNLIGNAKHACDESERADKRVTLRVTSDPERVFISVSDNGIGISTDNLTRIFQHGFTTRLHGHGFGLHSAALAAREMQGALRAHSDGPGQGASFILELPRAPIVQTA